MSTFETNINKLEKALENIKSVKGRIYDGTTIKKGMYIEKKLNEAITALESAKIDYDTIMKREEACKKNTMSEEEFKKVFTVERTSEHLHREFQLDESEINFLKKVANRSMYKVYCNLMRDKFNLDPISKVGVVGDITEYHAEYDEKEKKVKIKDDDGKAIAEYKPEFGSNLAITRLEIKDKEGHVLYQKDCSKADDKKSIVLRITDDDLKNLIYNRKGAVLYNHHTEAIELMWNLSLQENVYMYGLRIINLRERHSFFERVYEFNPDTEISLKTFKQEFINGLNKRKNDIIFNIRNYLDSTRTKEIEFLFDGEEK